MGHSSWLEWPWLSRRGMLTIKRTCFAACCSFSRLNTAFPHLDILPSSFILHEIEWFWRLEYIFLSLKKVSYCKCWWNFFFLYLPIIVEKQTSYLEWPWLSRRGMMTMRRTCFAACCSFSCPLLSHSVPSSVKSVARQSLTLYRRCIAFRLLDWLSMGTHTSTHKRRRR